MEAPAPKEESIKRTSVAAAIKHFLALKESKSPDTYRKNKAVLGRFEQFTKKLEYQFIDELRFPDLTDYCASWTGATRTKARDLGILTSFMKYCHQADFTKKNVAVGLFKTMNWPDEEGPREPFEPKEIEALWEVLPNFPDEYGRLGSPIALQVEAFVLLMRHRHGRLHHDEPPEEPRAWEFNPDLPHEERLGGLDNCSRMGHCQIKQRTSR